MSSLAILAESALSFLGLGLEPDAPSWGIMLQDARYWLEDAWWLAVFPGITISLNLISLQVLAEANGAKA